MDRFRTVLGHFCTGVTVVTTIAGDVPVGFACQSFAALSLDPPLVLFCPDRRSGTWPAIRDSGVFCVNVLAENQREISRLFGARGADRFSGTAWRPSPGECRDGQPLLFHRGAYAATDSRYPVDGELDNLLTWSQSVDWL